jgi:hypothetical protein
MSLRKSPQLTPQLLAASRQNAQHSTGPRSAAAKQNSKRNALKHVAYVSDENQRQAMLALGEDPAQFQTLTQELVRAFGPGDALWEKLDRSIDRKVRLLLRLRKELTNLRAAPAGQDDGARMENTKEMVESDNSSETSQRVETVENSKMKERCGNVIENKGK